MNSTLTDFDVDKIIDKLLEFKDKKPQKQVNLTETEIRNLCLKSREIFISQSTLIELEAPIKVCGKHSLCNSHILTRRLLFPCWQTLFYFAYLYLLKQDSVLTIYCR